MESKERLGELRGQIDGIDGRMVSLFEERMAIAGEIADLKGRNNMAILDADREQQVVDRAVSLAAPCLKGEVSLLMRSVMALTRDHERKLMFAENAPLLPPPREPVKEHIRCAFQGVPGAWSEQALIKLYPDARRQAVEYFEDVFLAVRENKVDYGVVAIENSQTGAIGETYDLLCKYGCFIVGRTWVDIRHCLLAPEGTGLGDIREVFSHPEGFRQCSRFLKGRPWDLTACRNTAVAAEMAARFKDGRTAAIGSPWAAEINGLKILEPDILDSPDNRTSFVVIASEPEYDEGSDLISVTFFTRHQAGALCETLLPFMAQGVNLAHIESRPAPQGKYRFFAELEGNILKSDIAAALRQATASCEYFEVIGCYNGI